MALQMTISTKSGLTIENAYVKVSDNLNLNRSSNSRLGYFRLEVYKDTDSRTSGKAQIKDPDFKRFYCFKYDLESSYNAIAQAYNYLKTLDEFQAAIDC